MLSRILAGGLLAALAFIGSGCDNCCRRTVPTRAAAPCCPPGGAIVPPPPPPITSGFPPATYRHVRH
jgi:hypothetical protein